MEDKQLDKQKLVDVGPEGILYTDRTKRFSQVQILGSEHPRRTDFQQKKSFGLTRLAQSAWPMVQHEATQRDTRVPTQASPAAP